MPLSQGIEQVGDAVQGYGCFSRAGHSLNNKRADIFVADNPVLFPLDGGNDIFHLVIGIGTLTLFLQNVIMDGQGTFNHKFHFAAPNSVLAF